MQGKSSIKKTEAKPAAKRVKKPKATPLTKKAQRFADAMALPNTPSGTKAAIKAGYAPAGAHVTASCLLKNPKVIDRIEKRKAEVAKYANITPAQVLGATALRAFATIHDALDAKGNFDIQKARRTGAVHLIKKIVRTPTKYGESVAVEFYSNESAQDKLGSYLGMEKLPADNPLNVEKVLQAYHVWIERNPQATVLEKADAIATFAKGRNVDEKELRERIGIEVVSEAVN